MPLPSKFYKYRSMDTASVQYVESTVLKNELYFAKSSQFNDPFDLSPVFSFEGSFEERVADFVRLLEKFEPGLMDQAKRQAYAEERVRLALDDGRIDSTTEQMMSFHRQEVADKTGVYCVSTTPSNILMWAHYGDSHRGICLEFDGMLGYDHTPLQVRYSQKREPVRMYKKSAEDLFKVFCTKSNHWSYEEEWRLIRPVYEGGPGVVHFSPNRLTGIVIGAMASPETVRTVFNWAEQRAPQINVYKAALSKSQFAVEISDACELGR